MDFPSDFKLCTRRWLGDEYPLLEAALQTEAPVSVRINLAKRIAPPVPSEQVKWCRSGYYLPERPSFTADPLFHAGTYYVQEASSMFLEQAVNQYLTTPVTCLDLCAAPGGKSTHLLSLLPADSLLVSNEVIRSRCMILAENAAKWGAPNVIVTNNDPKEIGQIAEMFDVIVADLPCSGEGMFRKDPASRKEWSAANVSLCAARQQRIICDAWPALKPGGLLIYSTCTFNMEENEKNIRFLIETTGATALPLSIEANWGIADGRDTTFPAYRFLPHRTKGEGFFLSVLRKPADGRQCRQASAKGKPSALASLPSPVDGWLNNPDEFCMITDGTVLRAVPVCFADKYLLIHKQLRIVMAGVTIGERKGCNIAPSVALALSTAFRRKAFPYAALTRDEALRYLRRETLVLPECTSKGYVYVTYNDTPLGFVKNIGSRANNLYPQEWRIKSRLC
ncbi:MAG: rRNA cytosine-C5-methyltransferase [Tannerella sp.]|nr:rRNA cytosine-C5-methyltransferase [Tannerella sp.]